MRGVVLGTHTARVDQGVRSYGTSQKVAFPRGLEVTPVKLGDICEDQKSPNSFPSVAPVVEGELASH